jgi:hypothetical protein
MRTTEIRSQLLVENLVTAKLLILMSIGKRLKKLVTGKKTQRTARKDTNTPKRTLMFATHVMGEYETSAKSATASNRKGLMQARNQTGQQLVRHAVLCGRRASSEHFQGSAKTAL